MFPVISSPVGRRRTFLLQWKHSVWQPTKLPCGRNSVQIQTSKQCVLWWAGVHHCTGTNTAGPQCHGIACTHTHTRTHFAVNVSHLCLSNKIEFLCVQYYNLNGKLPHITYEYTIPLESYDITAAEGVTTSPGHSHLNFTYNEVSEDGGGHHIKWTNHSRAFVTSRHPYNAQLGADDQSDIQLSEEEEEEEEVVWEIRTPSPPPPAAMLVYRPADVTSHVFSHNDVEEQGPPAPSGYREWDTNLAYQK